MTSTEGRDGGYRVTKSATLPPLSFTNGEAAAIAIALAVEPDLPFSDDGRAALSKVLSTMTDTQRSDLRTLGRKLWFRPAPTDGRPRAARTIDQAIESGVVVHVDYCDRHDVWTRNRSIEPLGLARIYGVWYVMAYCRMRKSGRYFRMSRIHKARITNERFPPRSIDHVIGVPPTDARPIEF